MKPLLSFEPPRGMRDFYPDDMLWRNRVFDAWRHAALSFGFQPYDACVVESLALLERKSGEEVSDQIYHFEDKSGRQLALRPEMTPTLARMVAARQGQLSMPLKWFTTAQCFRYERMTRGRKREHYQWNLDVIGSDSVAAEAEVLAAAATSLQGMGMPDNGYRIHISNRELLAELLAASGAPAEHHPAIFLALDKRGKLPDEEIAKLLASAGLDSVGVERTFELLNIQTLDQAAAMVAADSRAVADLRQLFALAEIYGIRERLHFDISIIRGLAYYTGIVFEAFDAQRKFRAIFGGGRYDNLLTTIGGAPTPAVGLGFGDVVVVEVLRDLLGSQAAAERRGVIVGYMFSEQGEAATRVATMLRQQGELVELQLAPQKPRSFFARAGNSLAADAIFIGPDDIANKSVRRKCLTTREEQVITLPESEGGSS